MTTEAENAEGGAETRDSAGLVQKRNGKERRISTATAWLKEERRINKEVDRRMQDKIYHLMEDTAYRDVIAKYKVK